MSTINKRCFSRTRNYFLRSLTGRIWGHDEAFPKDC